MLEADLHHRLGELEVDIGFRVADGSCLALAGPSGAGKTTILRLLAGTLRPTSGCIRRGSEVWLDTERGVWSAPEQRQCGYVFQDYALFPHLSAWRNVAFGLPGISYRRRGGRRAEAIRLLERFGIAKLADVRPVRLSGGEQQRVALARALARAPSALLLDEPLAALDARSRSAATSTLASVVRSLDIPVVLVTHDFTDASLLANEIAVVDQGAIVQRGSAGDLASRPGSAFVADFTGAVVLTGEAKSRQAGLTLIELDGGGVVGTAERASGRVAVSVYPWEITISRPPGPLRESAQNHLSVKVDSMTRMADRVRIGLCGPQQLVAEVTDKAAVDLQLEIGTDVIASWKATATRLSAV